MTILELTDEDARLFIEFRKHQDIFTTLLLSGLFELSSGKVEVNVNNGQVQNVFVRQRVFNRLTPEIEGVK